MDVNGFLKYFEIQTSELTKIAKANFMEQWAK